MASINSGRSITRLRPIQARGGLTEEVVEILRRNIVQGRFRRAQRLNEARLAGELQISRGPIREAIRVLIGEGLVQESPGRGVFVVSLSARDIEELLELRAGLEGYAARLLAQHMDDRKALELNRGLQALSDAVASQDNNRLWTADINFHESICRLSGNDRLYKVMGVQMRVLRAMFLSEGFPHEDVDTAVESHRELCNRILAGDGETAARAVEKHALSGRASVMRYALRLGLPAENSREGPQRGVRGAPHRDASRR